MNRMNIITLGVKDVSKSLDFYKKLGFNTPNNESNPSIVFFSNQGTKLALYPLDLLIEDLGVDVIKNTGFSGFTIAHNCKTKDEVDKIFSLVEKAGGTIIKKPELVFWGGYSGYFKDLDNNYWEVAYAETWQFDENDMLIIK